MTRRDYVKFAKLIYNLAKDHENDPDTSCFVGCLKTGIADIFAIDNHRFNREKFYQACEQKGGKCD